MQRELGRYRLLRHLASGGMGEVFLAEAPGAAGFAKRVVIKTVREELARDPDLVRQFIDEGRLLEALDHPNIAQILDLGHADGTYFLAMELVEGFDLRALQRAVPTGMGDRQRLGEASVLYIVACVAHALDHAQSRRGPDGRPLRIVHHDVSPSNIMVRRDGHVKLVDFGVAHSALLGRLAPGALRGKLSYLSPEHVAHGRIDGRADLFALGLVAFELLSGQRALDIGEVDALQAAHARLPARLDAVAEAARLGPGCVALLHDMMAAERDRRPDGAEAVAARAQQLLVGLGEASPARALAAELAGAFDALEAKSRSFDQTLAQMIGVAGTAPQDATGTLSLPGAEAVAIAAESARAEPQPVVAPERRLRKRVVTAAVALLVLSGVGGWWLGARGTAEEAALASLQPASSAPVPQAVARPAAPSTVAPPGVPSARLPDPAVLVAGPSKPHAPWPAPPPSGLPRNATPVAAAASEAESATPATDVDSLREPAARKNHEPRSATVTFRVQPVDCSVRIDGQLQRPGAGSAYVVRLAPGDHELVVRDPMSGLTKRVRLDGLREGEVRPLLGGVCLGSDCL
ncbi:MAG: serine/threonine protein kinase [Myxococcales bacterium]|nr:serine/threonine protein kinase [Myxococcales bacterium]